MEMRKHSGEGLQNIHEDFPGDSVTKIPSFQCREIRFDPWSGN